MIDILLITFTLKIWATLWFFTIFTLLSYLLGRLHGINKKDIGPYLPTRDELDTVWKCLCTSKAYVKNKKGKIEDYLVLFMEREEGDEVKVKIFKKIPSSMPIDYIETRFTVGKYYQIESRPDEINFTWKELPDNETSKDNKEEVAILETAV
jgi:hypothetical protein